MASQYSRFEGTASRTGGTASRVPLLPTVHTSDLQLADIDNAVRVPGEPSGRSPLGSRHGARPMHHGSRITSRMSGKTARAPSARSALLVESAADLPIVPTRKLPKLGTSGTAREVASGWNFFTDVNCSTRKLRRPLKDTGVPLVDAPRPWLVSSAPEDSRPRLSAMTAREFTTQAHQQPKRSVGKVPAEGFLPAVRSPAQRTTVNVFFRARSQAVAPSNGAHAPATLSSVQLASREPCDSPANPGSSVSGGAARDRFPTDGDAIVPMALPLDAADRLVPTGIPSLNATMSRAESKGRTPKPHQQKPPIRGYAALRHNPPMAAHEELQRIERRKPLPPLEEYLSTFNATRDGTMGSLAEATLAFEGDLRPPPTPPPAVDLTKTHAEQLQSVAGTCIDVFVEAVPLAADERGYAEESLKDRVELRELYLSRHPVQHVALASNLPTELREAVASVTTRVPNPNGSGTVATKTVVPVEWSRDAAVQQNVALMKPRGLDYKVVNGAVARLSDPAVPVDREGRLAYLRARQKDAELYFGLHADTSTNAERMSKRAGETAE